MEVKVNYFLCRSVPLGLRQSGSDELLWGPFSPDCRSERYRPRYINKLNDYYSLALKMKKAYIHINRWLVLTCKLLAGINPQIDSRR